MRLNDGRGGRVGGANAGADVALAAGATKGKVIALRRASTQQENNKREKRERGAGSEGGS